MSATAKIDRQTTTPFLLKLFYRAGSFLRLDDFSPDGPLPPHLQIYTWQSCSLRELTALLTSALPNLLPSPAAGTRVAYRLVYPDTRPASTRHNEPGRYISKELGSVVVGATGTNIDVDMDGADAAEDDANKTLQDARFLIGDYVSCTILPPLANGAVAPVPSGQGSAPRGGYGGPPRNGTGGPRDEFRGARDGYGPPRENGFGGGGYGGRGGGRGGYGGGGGGDLGRGPNVPLGEWRRGEQLPQNGRGGYGRDGGGGGGGRGRRGGY